MTIKVPGFCQYRSTDKNQDFLWLLISKFPGLSSTVIAMIMSCQIPGGIGNTVFSRVKSWQNVCSVESFDERQCYTWVSIL